MLSRLQDQIWQQVDINRWNKKFVVGRMLIFLIPRNFQDALLNWKEIVGLAQEKVGELRKMLTQLKNVGLTQENVCITFENCVPNS
jgi:hypothetical protein